MASRGRLDLMQNVTKCREMVLHLQHSVLHFSDWPERVENDTIKPSAGCEQPHRELQQGLVVNPGESEIASLLPRKSDPRAPTFCKMFNGAMPPAPTGETWKPVGAVRKKMFALSGTRSAVSSELA